MGPLSRVVVVVVVVVVVDIDAQAASVATSGEWACGGSFTIKLIIVSYASSITLSLWLKTLVYRCGSVVRRTHEVTQR